MLLIDEIANLRAADASVFAWLRAVGQESTSIVLVGSELVALFGGLPRGCQPDAVCVCCLAVQGGRWG